MTTNVIFTQFSIALHVLAPILVIFSLLQKHNNFFSFIISTLILCVVALIFIKAFRWDIAGLDYKVIFAIFTILSLVVGVFRNFDLFGNLGIASITPLQLIGIFVGLICVIALAIYIYKTESSDDTVSLTSPIKSLPWIVAQGGFNIITNPHRAAKAQKHALDIVILNDNRRRAAGLLPYKLSDYVSYDKPIYSPCDGSVIGLKDGILDRPIGRGDKRNPFGNYIALYCSGYTILLAHLRSGSINVSHGDKVQKGDYLAKIGNSGNTTEPHLHIHAIKGHHEKASVIQATGDPIQLLIDGKLLVKGDGIIDMLNSD